MSAAIYLLRRVERLTRIALSQTADAVSNATRIIAGPGLTGGGALNNNVTLSADLSAVTPAAVATAWSVGGSIASARADHAHALPFATVQSVLGAATAAVGVNGQTVTNLAAPVNATDAATKAYADSIAAGLNLKQSVNALSSGVIALTGTQTIDGVALVAGNRVLVAGQGGNVATAHVNNGVYVVAAGAWARAADVPAASNAQGVFTFVSSGTSFGDSGWVCVTDAPNAVVGANALQFSQFSAAAPLTAGAGISIVGNTITVATTGDGSIVAGGGGVAVGALASDVQHGPRGGGTLHALAVANGADGFMTGADKAKLDGLASGNVSIVSQAISLATLQALGAVGVGTVNVGPVPPANARIFAVEVQVTQAFAAPLLSVAVATVQGASDALGSMCAPVTVLTTGNRSAPGLNLYFSRAGSQVQVTVTLTGAVLSALTAGALTVNYLMVAV